MHRRLKVSFVEEHTNECSKVGINIFCCLFIEFINHWILFFLLGRSPLTRHVYRITILQFIGALDVTKCRGPYVREQKIGRGAVTVYILCFLYPRFSIFAL